MRVVVGGPPRQRENRVPDRSAIRRALHQLSTSHAVKKTPPSEGEGGGGDGTPACPVEMHGDRLFGARGRRTHRPDIVVGDSRGRCKVVIVELRDDLEAGAGRRGRRRRGPPMMTGVGPLDHGRVVQPEGLVMMRQHWAVDRLEDRAEELARFQVIDVHGHRPSGSRWDSRSWIHRRLLPVVRGRSEERLSCTLSRCGDLGRSLGVECKTSARFAMELNRMCPEPPPRSTSEEDTRVQRRVVLSA